MKNILIILTCLTGLLAVPPLSHAKEAPKKKTVKLDPSAPLIADAECRYLAEYQPSPVNGAEYVPGVDAYGKPVVEADLTPSVVKVPEKFSFNITVDVARYIGLSVPTGIEGNGAVGAVTVEKGQARFNGQPLEGDAVAALKALCAPPVIAPSPEKKLK